MCLYIINYTPTFYFPCIINLKVSLGREKCIEHCRGCRSGDMARPGRGQAWQVGQVWCRTGCCPNIYIYSRQCSDTHQHDRVWRVESTLLGIRLVSTQLLSPAPLRPLAPPRPPARQTPDCSKQRVWTVGVCSVCCPAQLACFATIKTVSQQD